MWLLAEPERDSRGIDKPWADGRLFCDGDEQADDDKFFDDARVDVSRYLEQQVPRVAGEVRITRLA